jgi:hypothetical protein
MELQTLGRALLFIGSGLVLLGLIILIIARTGIASGLSDLPGTLRIEGPGITCVVPILASIVLSILLTLGLNLLLRWLNRP